MTDTHKIESDVRARADKGGETILRCVVFATKDGETYGTCVTGRRERDTGRTYIHRYAYDNAAAMWSHESVTVLSQNEMTTLVNI